MMKMRIAAVAASGAIALAIAGCASQTADVGMTDGEIMAAIEQGDADTLAKAKAATKQAVDDAVAGIDGLTDEERADLKADIMAEVEKRLSEVGGTVVNRYVTEEYPTYTTQEGDTYVTEENTFVTQGEEKPPRIEDGVSIPAEWEVGDTFVDSDGCVFTVESVEAHAYNFAEDTPYAGGGYAYRIEVEVAGSFVEKEHDPSVGHSMHSGWPLPVSMVMHPYDVLMSGGSASCDYDDHTFENTYTMNVNMLPERVYAVAEE